MSATITVFTIVLVMNAINFIDGLDGLVAGVALIANGVFFLYSYLLVQQTRRRTTSTSRRCSPSCSSARASGSCRSTGIPAKLFMGDAGALLMGLLMATSAIAVTGQVDPSLLGTDELFPAPSSRSSSRSRCS